MTAELPPQVLDLLRDRNYAVIAALDGKGRPHQTLVWVDTDGRNVIVNSAQGRAKVRHLERNPIVSLLVFHRHDFYHWARISGRVVDMTTGGAEDHIHQLAKRYWDKERYPLAPDMIRVRIVIEPMKVLYRRVPSPTLM